MDVLDEKLNGLENRVDTRLRRMEDRLTSIEGNLTWIVRLIVGGLVLAALGILINGTSAMEAPIFGFEARQTTPND